ncbi:HlyD family efflux transporter periplasmic adaptor subunit [uncultured Cohaesibacter sp.]|uniref:HlyD family efflux transporter periplasmic adaptor subunit n=1 Tax=uncultured Cohaesibacter sp. TaxID=1002546 RepID=UPI0029C7258C|nr:HlyD family efflux transporter periplasmic adaptor subunit [uncultured Cohaesibacter sp.]
MSEIANQSDEENVTKLPGNPKLDQGHTDRKAKRAPLFLGLFVAVAAVGGGYYAYDVLYASKHEITDNAYVGADIANITPLVAAQVREVKVSDTQHVTKGDVLVTLDDTDASLQLQQTDAAYQQALRGVRALQATDKTLLAQIEVSKANKLRAEAQFETAKATFDQAKIGLERRQTLAEGGSVSGDELTAAETAFKTAQANLDGVRASLDAAQAGLEAAQGAQQANAAMIEGVSAENNPQVLAAKAARDQAQVNLDRTVIRAPIDGVISRRQVQIGERVQPGMRLMVVVPLQEVYVDANFKEVQLAKVKPGQSVSLSSDLYGDEVTFNGTVEGFSGGTGAAFSAVPAQNATGNWIKVVQRLPVRIKLDPNELKDHPLEVGLSMTADIHVAE